MCLHGFQIWPSRADLVMSKLDLFPYSDVPIYLCYYFTIWCFHNLFSPQGIFANILTRFSLVIRYSRTETQGLYFVQVLFILRRHSPRRCQVMMINLCLQSLYFFKMLLFRQSVIYDLGEWLVFWRIALFPVERTTLHA